MGFIKPEYVYLKLTPHSSIRNNNTANIAKTMTIMYRNFALDLFKTAWKFIRRQEKEFNVETNMKCSYFIDIRKDDISFILIVPKKYEHIFKEKIRESWKRATIDNIESIELFSNEALKYEIYHKKESALSLNVDKRSNEPLNSILNVVEIMQDNDRLGIFYNFMPRSQLGWKSEYKRTIDKIKSNEPIDKEKANIGYTLKLAGTFILKLLDEIVGNVLEMLGGKDNNKNELSLLESAVTILSLNSGKISSSTDKKQDAIVVDGQILILSESEDWKRKETNAIAVCNSYRSIDEEGGNSLTYRKVKKNVHYVNEFSIARVETSTFSIDEITNFLQLPGRELQEQFKAIKSNKVISTWVPELLREGYISLGINEYLGNETEAFTRDNYDHGSMPIVLVGEQGAGKTTYMSNYINYTRRRTEGVIIIDFIKNCALSKAIQSVVPKEDVIVINHGDLKNMQGFGYNEYHAESDDPEELLQIANDKALFISMLIDAVNVFGEPLTSSMDNYLNAACNVVLLDPKASLKEVIKVLQNHEYRSEVIKNIPEELRGQLEDDIFTLQCLDKKEKGNVIGTDMKSIDGILHRVNVLRKDIKLKTMFNKGPENNIDLIKAMDEGKVVIIEMPQNKFPTPLSKNVLVTYYLTKIWAVELQRGAVQDKPNKVHVIIDEPFQTPTAMDMLAKQEILPQTRKFGCRFVVSCQNLTQIKKIETALRSAGASYLLMKGTNKDNFNEFKDEIEPYTIDDLNNLPQYSSLNLINYEGGKAKFITKLPPPLIEINEEEVIINGA